MAKDDLVWLELSASGNTAAIWISNSSITKASLVDNVKSAMWELLWETDFLSTNVADWREVAILAKTYIEKYGFENFNTTRNFEYLSRVITIADYEENKLQYIDKLSKWFWTFPLEIDFDQLEKVFAIWIQFDWWNISFQHSILMDWEKTKSHALALALKNTKISKAITQWYIKMDIFNFLVNYDKICEFISNELSEDKQSSAFTLLQLYRTSAMAMLDIVLKITIKNPLDVIENKQITSEDKSILISENNPFMPVNEEEFRTINAIEDLLLSTIVGTSNDDIDKLLPINNLTVFTNLLDAVIENILEDTKKNKTWLNWDNKSLSDYSATELIAFATYISRVIISEYATLDDMIKDIANTVRSWSIQWKCTDFTWLTLQIINNYFKVKFSEKFEWLHFWYDNQDIWEYKHVYIKIFRKNSQWWIDVWFFDPTKLSSHWIKNMKTPDDIFKMADASNLPIQIDRSAEDLLNTFRLKQLTEKWWLIALAHKLKNSVLSIMK